MLKCTNCQHFCFYTCDHTWCLINVYLFRNGISNNAGFSNLLSWKYLVIQFCINFFHQFWLPVLLRRDDDEGSCSTHTYQMYKRLQCLWWALSVSVLVKCHHTLSIICSYDNILHTTLRVLILIDDDDVDWRWVLVFSPKHWRFLACLKKRWWQQHAGVPCFFFPVFVYVS